MTFELRKAIRTIQSQLWFLKEQKDDFYHFYRRLLRVPHDRDFAALSLFGNKLPGCYVDVGGNQGQSIESIRLYVPHGRIVSFEPNPILSEKLARRYAHDQSIRISSIGLSDRTDQIKLYVPSYRGFVYDGLASLNRAAAESWINEDTVYFFRPDRLIIKEFDCVVDTLDSQNLDPLFIKIDVQGTEYDVVKGGMETIQRCHPVLLIEGFMEDPKLAQLVSSLGYEAYVFENSTLHRAEPRGRNAFLITRNRFQTLMDR